MEAKITKMKVKRNSCRTSRRVNQVTNRREIEQIQDSCCADRFQLSTPSRKTVEIHQAAVHRDLRERAEVDCDGAGSARTAQGLVAVACRCVPCGKLELWKITERIVEVPVVQKEQIQQPDTGSEDPKVQMKMFRTSRLQKIVKVLQVHVIDEVAKVPGACGDRFR